MLVSGGQVAAAETERKGWIPWLTEGLWPKESQTDRSVPKYNYFPHSSNPMPGQRLDLKFRE